MQADLSTPSPVTLEPADHSPYPDPICSHSIGVEMPRKAVLVGFFALMVVTACTPSADSARPSGTPILPPGGSLNPAYTARLSSEAAQATNFDPSPAVSASSMSSPPIATSSESTSARPLDSYDRSEGIAAYVVSVDDSIPASDYEQVERALILTRDALVLNDLINQNPQDITLTGELSNYYFGQLLADREAGVAEIRASGRMQTGWTSGVLTAVEFTNGTTRVEGCLSASGMKVTDASGQPVALVNDRIHVLAGVATYDPGLRLAHLEFGSAPADSCQS